MLRPEMDTEKQAQAAAAAVDTRELVSLLQQMVRIRSYSAGGEEGTIARFMRDYLAKLGLEVELQEVQPDRFNCISRMPGTGGGASLMLNGHLDTNPAGEGWTKDPFVQPSRAGLVSRWPLSMRLAPPPVPGIRLMQLKRSG